MNIYLEVLIQKYHYNLQANLKWILEAGTYAPTGIGAQCSVIVVIQDKKTRDYVSKLNAKVLGSNADPLERHMSMMEIW